jgi:hypothetical protein
MEAGKFLALKKRKPLATRLGKFQGREETQLPYQETNLGHNMAVGYFID